MDIRKVGKVAVTAVIAVAMVATLAAPAQAQTSAQLQAQIDALLAQIAALQAQLAGGASTGVSCTFTRSLFQGVSGEDVRCLQRYLNAAGFTVATSGAGSAGFETMYYGPLTTSAVARWQAAHNVSPAVGYFGPISTAKYNALVQAGSPGTGDDDDDGDNNGELEGGAGSINDADFITSLNNEEVGEGEQDVEVAGLELEADDGSDIELTAVRLIFDHAGGTEEAGSSNNLPRYADEISVWFNGERVARSDADDFTEGAQGVWSRTLSLDSGAIIRMSDTEDLVVAVSAVGNIDSDDEGEEWSVEIDSVRFRDAQGAVISDTSTGDIGATRIFSFEAFASAADTKMKISLNDDDDDINDAHLIDVDSSSRTNNVPVLSFNIEVEGNADLFIDEIVVDFTTSEDDLNDVISAAHLLLDGDDQVGTENVTSEDATDVPVTFDDLNLTLEPGTHNFVVAVNFEAIDASFVEGTTLLAEITDDETDSWVVEDASGEDLADGDKTGTAVGDAHSAYDNGFTVTLVSTEANVIAGNAQASENDRAEFKIVYDVTAFGSTIYLGTSTDDADTATAEHGVNYDVLINGAVDTDATSTAILTMSNSSTDGTTGAFKVLESQTRRFTLTVNLTASEDNFFEIQMESIGWSADTDATADANTYPLAALAEFDAGPVFMNAR